MQTKTRKPKRDCSRLAERGTLPPISERRADLAPDRERRDKRIIERLELRLATQIRKTYYDDRQPLAAVLKRFGEIRPEPWIRDVIFYRTFPAADELGAFQ